MPLRIALWHFFQLIRVVVSCKLFEKNRIASIFTEKKKEELLRSISEAYNVVNNSGIILRRTAVYR